MDTQQTEAKKLSIVIITHNHQAYINRTIESILNQKLLLSYEIIICDDASTDNTVEIILSYHQKHPEIFNTYFSPVNKGPMQMAKQSLSMCKGQYLAWLDGDDYWLYENKLQYQIDFLDTHCDYAACFHDALIVSEKNHTSNNDSTYYKQWKCFSQFNKYTPDFYPWQLLERQLIPTASLVCRKNLLDIAVFEKFSEMKLSINWLLQLMIIKNSKFRYINEQWSVYYNHHEGMSKKVDKQCFKLSNIHFLKKLLNDGYYTYLRKDIYKAIALEYYQLLDIYKGQKKKLIKLTFRYILYEFKKIISEIFYFFRK